MSTRIDAEPILDAFLAPEGDRIADRVIEAALADIARTPQRRAVRAPWRFLTMPASSRSIGIAAVVLVAVVGVGGLIYLNSSSRGAVGGPAATPTPTVVPTQSPAQVAPGIAGWKDYKSNVYGFQMGYPSDWTVYSPATREWKASDGQANADNGPYAAVFANTATDKDSMGLWVWEMPAGEGATLDAVTGLKAWAQTYCESTAGTRDGGVASCKGFTDKAKAMCLDAGGDACRAALLVSTSDEVSAYFMDWPSVMLTSSPDKVRVVSIGRPDAFPAAVRYGGSVQLLTSILTTMGVHTPANGQAPTQ